jgi:hypothetical protein
MQSRYATQLLPLILRQLHADMTLLISYALLMLCHKSRNMNRSTHHGSSATAGLEELYFGIQRVLSAPENYAIAFEAIDGMRGSQIQPLGVIVDADTTTGQIQEALEAALDYGLGQGQCA